MYRIEVSITLEEGTSYLEATKIRGDILKSLREEPLYGNQAIIDSSIEEIARGS